MKLALFLLILILTTEIAYASCYDFEIKPLYKNDEINCENLDLIRIIHN